MDQEVVINKILRDLKLMEIISEENGGRARIFLNVIWVAGYEYAMREERKNNNRERPIIQYDINHKPIKEYRSIIDACRKLGYARNTVILRALKTGTLTQKRHLWEYKKGPASVTDPQPKPTMKNPLSLFKS